MENSITRRASSDKISSIDLSNLVARAAAGDETAWDALVEQYTRLVWSVTRGFRLSDSDAADVTQITWMRLLEHISRIDPGRIGAWLSVTARRECIRLIALRKRVALVYDDATFDDTAVDQPEPGETLLADEQASEVRRAVETLPKRWQQMLAMLMTDPPSSYAEISDKLGFPIGSIGPIRGRCMARLRDELGPSYLQY